MSLLVGEFILSSTKGACRACGIFFQGYKETVFCGFLATVVIAWRIYLDHKEKYLFKEGRFGFCTLKEPEEK